MKKISYLLISVLCLAMTACMDGDYSEPDFSGGAPYGNNAIKETNLVTIQQLKDKYKKAITTDYSDGMSFEQVKEKMQIRGFVTANDISGNIYNEVSIQDETGAILIEIQQGGLHGYLPVGTEIIVELQGLCVGNYRLQPVVGMPSKVTQGTNAGKDQIGKITRREWQQHFRITGKTKVMEPEVFVENGKVMGWKTMTDGGKLGVLKNVKFKEGSYYSGTSSVKLKLDENSKFADPAFNTSVSWYFEGLPTTGTETSPAVMLYNSSYADFASNTLPMYNVDITGVIKRYNNSWEVIIRDLNDIVPTTAER
ncbi:MAG: DUF5689 domain-containing protein [Prevotella sp.]|uniref:DUF5689 domain-containing protein n=1 Tax=Prevotella sp. TaxID=59823 RepID=UPI002A32ED37|nr:DUF5689 domain-containing protein [Prevotella sp.]MDD7317466.1 DUF5689 domain-containing protein [Prevotellaceae bacterium]MDY4019198.1 DUF5689 domain-containing protein [Prevotella sp.]